MLKMNFFSQKVILFLLVVSSLSAQDYTSLLKENLLQTKSSNGLTQQDIASLKIYNQSTSKQSGVEHVYAVQQFNGIEVFNANVTAAFRGDKLIYLGDNLQFDIEARVRSGSPTLSPIQAATTAASALGAGIANFTVLETISVQEVILDKGGVSNDNVSVKLVYELTSSNEFRLAWDLDIHMINQPHWYSVRVDASSGEILSKYDLIVGCTFGDHNQGVISDSRNRERTPSFGFKSKTATVASVGSQYNVFPIPVESPNHGSSTLVVDPHDLEASPFGWHDTDGIAGAEFTITRGNNVYAQDDLNGNNGIGTSPDGGESLDFNSEFNLDTEPRNMLDAATTNLFYWNNVIHDVMYHYGFDEESGNFQEFNYGGEGQGGDSVTAEAQDGISLNNAVFATPPEGVRPRMSMFLWNATDAFGEVLTIIGGPLDGNYTGALASFGESFSEDVSLTGNLVLLRDDNSGDSEDDLDACDTVTNQAELVGNIAVIRRGACEFGTKVLAAENAGAIGAIVVNSNDNAIFAMPPGVLGGQVTIPSIMITRVTGEAIITTLQGGESIAVSIRNTGPFQRDGSLDNGVVVHEYGHGISRRLSGGPMNVLCLTNEEEMGEGWSDYYGLMFTMTIDDVAEQPRGVGTYILGQGPNSFGIRVRPYTTDLGINDLTYGDVNNTGFISSPHGIGTVWATMLWDMTWMLIDRYGFDPDLYNGTGGNNIALQLVTDGLKLQPCSPGFVDGRDAILAAIDINTMITDEDKAEITCAVWGVFAARGLGVSADQGNSDSRIDQIEAFDTPSRTDESSPCFDSGALSADEFVKNSFSVFPNPSDGKLSINMDRSLGDGKIQIIDLNGRIVFSQEMFLEGTLNINAGDLANGVYLIKVANQSISETTKLIIR